MSDLFTVEEAARALELHPQTIYRKIKRGEIACLKIGKTIRIHKEALFDSPKKIPPKKLPSFLKRLFWDIEFEEIDPSSALFKERLLELGDVKDIKFLFSIQNRNLIRNFLINYGEKRLSPKSYNFWSNFFDIKNASGNITRNSEKSLGETSWR